ncbi:PilZ domain-containing protein [Paraliobacillus quinghaiensis]|uniref:PilZ domain-containing protein n=1 Tax=Paraliobacillus quinghaiensis TaxID=470815 RepID=UPI0013C2C3CC|nr:PilZ domain-containing protein [Paraliobacillus quinghaiensis]
MRYNRQEPLRYTFAKPIEGDFTIIINDHNDPEDQTQHKTGSGRLEVIDLSPGGMRFATELDLPLNEKDFLIEVSFRFVEEDVKMVGNLVWKKEKVKRFEYGLDALEDDNKDNQIMSFLKKIHGG